MQIKIHKSEKNVSTNKIDKKINIVPNQKNHSMEKLKARKIKIPKMATR